MKPSSMKPTPEWRMVFSGLRELPLQLLTDTRQQAGVVMGAFGILDLKAAGFTIQPNFRRASFQIEPDFLQHFQAGVRG